MAGCYGCSGQGIAGARQGGRRGESGGGEVVGQRVPCYTDRRRHAHARKQNRRSNSEFTQSHLQFKEEARREDLEIEKRIEKGKSKLRQNFELGRSPLSLLSPAERSARGGCATPGQKGSLLGNARTPLSASYRSPAVVGSCRSRSFRTGATSCSTHRTRHRSGRI